MVLERLKNLISKVLDGRPVDYDAITEQTSLSEVGLTSISMLLMALAIEEEFDITITHMEGHTFETVGDVCNYIRTETGKN